MPEINPDRLLSDLRELATFGAYKTGVHRPTFSPQDVEARHWFAKRLEAAGLEAKIDGIGSVFGFSRAPGPVMLTGSHLESQNYAGWLDGPLGVVYGLETARALREDPACGRSRRRCRGLVRRGGAFRLLPRQPLLRRRPLRGRDRQCAQPLRRTPLRDALPRSGLCRSAARAA
jgi:hypothetical protein